MFLHFQDKGGFIADFYFEKSRRAPCRSDCSNKWIKTKYADVCLIIYTLSQQHDPE